MPKDEELQDVKNDISDIRQVLGKIEYVIEEVLVGIKDRLHDLEDFKDNMVALIPTTCETKTKEIAEGDSKVLLKSIGAVVFLFGLFCTAIVHFNSVDSSLDKKINALEVSTLKQFNTYQANISKNTVKLDHIIDILKDTDRKEHKEHKEH